MLRTPVKRKFKTGGLRKLGRERSEKNVRNIPATVRLNEEESRELQQYAAAYSLSVTESMWQLYRDNAPQPEPPAEFWQLLSTLYEVCTIFKRYVPYYPTVAETCKEIESFILELQHTFIPPQRFDVTELVEEEVVWMAATSLWHIEGCLEDFIDYVESPEKTAPNETLQDFSDVFSYVRNPEKTSDGEYVTAIDCLKETVLQQMILIKKQYQKTDGYITWHGCQSFKPDKATPDRYHEIGLRLAWRTWNDRHQVIGTTHLGKRHQHDHFCLSSVSFIDGQKYNYSGSEQKGLRDMSDKLCSEYRLSVVEHPKKAPSEPLMKEKP